MTTTVGEKRQVYRFGEFSLDPARGILSRGGDDIDLRPKSFEVLRYLVEHHGRLVSKDDLFEAVWGNAIVTDGSITQCLIDIRRALGDSDRRTVRTIPRRGYVFELPVETIEPAAAPTRRDGRRWGLYALPALPLLVLLVWAGGRLLPPDEPPAGTRAPGLPTVAVLPFVEFGETSDQRYFAEGIAEDILNRLSRAPDLRVIARTSSFALGSGSDDIPTVARKLRASHVLEGSVRRAEERLRVTAQLVDASTNTAIWSKSYDRRLDDMLVLQQEVAASVAASLQTSLAGESRVSEAARNAKAYERYLQGRFFYNRRARGDLDRALHYFRESLDEHPEQAPVWAALSGVWFIKIVEGETDPETGWFRMREAFQRALAIDPDDAESHVRAGQYHFMDGDRDAARRHHDRAIELDPNNVLVLGVLAGRHQREGRLEDAIAVQRRAVSLDPLNAAGVHNLAVFLTYAGRYHEALEMRRTALEINPEYEPEYRLWEARLLVLQRRFDEAFSRAGTWPEGALRSYALAMILSATGDEAAADRALDELIEYATESPPEDAAHDHYAPRLGLLVAEVCAQQGEVDRALDWLARDREDFIRNRALSGLFEDWSREARFSPFLTPLHDDPRWQELMTSAAAMANRQPVR